jgi:hypothetical protein
MPKISEGQFALGFLAVVTVWLLVVLPLLYRPTQQTPQVYAQQQTDSALKGEKNSESRPQPAANPNEEYGRKHSEQGENEGTEFWPAFLGIRLKITDSLLAVFTAGLLIFTGLLWRSTDKLWLGGEKQLRLAREALVSDQRAWLVVTNFRIESLNFAKVVNGAADAQADVYIGITNVGRTPALKVDVQLSLIGNYATEASAVCEFAVQSYKGALVEGRMVAAGEELDENIVLSVSGGELYRYGEHGRIRPLIVGCVTYQILQDSEFRQTAFVYRPERVIENPTIYIYGGDLTVNEVRAATGIGGFAS